VKRLFWFSVGAVTGAVAATRLADKVKRDGIVVTIAEAQAWAAPRIATILKQLTAGERGNGIS
jgi:hypothetical protein